MISNLTVLVALLFICSFDSLASTNVRELERQIEKLPVQEKLLNKYSISKIIEMINKASALREEESCVESKYVSNSTKFVTSYDKDGNPCKIYDRSFPTLLSGKSDKFVISRIPLKRYEALDYWKWLNGDYEHIIKMNQNYVDNFDPGDFKYSWVNKLPFKKHIQKNKKGIISSFHLSDIKIRDFYFNEKEKIKLHQIFESPKSVNDSRQIYSLIEAPNKFLEKIKFEWNDLTKLYDVVLEFDFLPLKSPIALVDYNIQYKHTVEKMIRTVMKKALLYLANKIIEPNTKRIVTLAIDESFYFVDMTYEYHLNQLESTLRLNMDDIITSDIATSDINKGLNILFANKGSLLVQYLMSLVTGQNIDLDRLDKIGKVSRYSAEKQRKNTMRTLYSDLALKKGCQMENVFRYFGLCTLDSNKQYLYSLLNSHKVLVWDFGAVKSFDYQSPNKVLFHRTSAYILANALRVFGIPFLPSMVTNKLVSTIRKYSVNGSLEEAFLLNELTELKRSNGVESEDINNHIRWFFRQTMNPLLVHSEDKENKIITNSRF